MQMKRWTALLALLVLAVSACGSENIKAASSSSTPSSSTPSSSIPGTSPTGPTDLTKALLAIENQPKYKPSDWGYIAIDQKTGEVLAAQNADKMFDPGSTMKSFSVTAALKAYGNDYKFTTPVYRVGDVNGHVLKGNLVLVGSGDLSFGLREQPNGSLSYENQPVLDHSYANLGIPGAVEPPGDPLAVLDQFAQQVKAAGISRVNGDVVVDDRLFTPIQWPDGPVSPIWVNENLIDIQVSPGSAAGQPTTVDWRPKTASYTVESQATTVAATEPTQLFASEPTPGHIVVTGQIAAGFPTTLVSQVIADPSAFARTAFIEALQRAGITVEASPTGPNPAALLPPTGSYQPGDKLAEHTSASLAAYVQLIMKISYNRGADLMTCLAAVKSGSTDCEQGLVAEVDNFTALGVSKDAVFPFDGAGSNDQNRASPRALATFYKNATGAPYAQALFDSLPILGKDGSLANIQPDSPAAGKAQLKTGNRAAGPPTTGQTILLGNTLAGYVQGKSGRRFTVMVGMGNMPFTTIAEFVAVTQDQAKMVTAMQQAF
jgi:D-alanyl-D-alanine carboxypeptidase/D-alanyl-D-alanine-endopeptidase (penicillin-binding protein 4)